jgi:hypothetical protein
MAPTPVKFRVFCTCSDGGSVGISFPDESSHDSGQSVAIIQPHFNGKIIVVLVLSKVWMTGFVKLQAEIASEVQMVGSISMLEHSCRMYSSAEHLMDPGPWKLIQVTLVLKKQYNSVHRMIRDGYDMVKYLYVYRYFCFGIVFLVG